MYETNTNTNTSEQFNGSYAAAGHRLLVLDTAITAARGESLEEAPRYPEAAGMLADGRLVHLASVGYSEDNANENILVAVGSANSDAVTVRQVSIPTRAQGLQYKDGSHSWLQLPDSYTPEAGSDMEWLSSNVGRSIYAHPRHDGEGRAMQVDDMHTLSQGEIWTAARQQEATAKPSFVDKLAKKPGILRRLIRR